MPKARYMPGFCSARAAEAGKSFGSQDISIILPIPPAARPFISPCLSSSKAPSVRWAWVSMYI